MEQRASSGQRIIVGISGSSGVIYGVRLLEALREYSQAEIHLVLSPAAEDNIRIETDRSVADVKALADVVHKHSNLAAPISSGSFRTAGMVVAPCSMKSLSEIAYSNSNNLLARAADVCLKERRKLVIVPRETPLHKGHLEMMLRVTDLGGVVLMPVPSFYHGPRTINDVIDQTIGKILDQFDIEHTTSFGGGRVAEQDLRESQDSSDLRDRARALLTGCTTMTLATDGPEGLWAADVFFAPRGFVELFFISSPSSRHARNFLASPAVSATVHVDVGNDWRSIRGLQLSGEAARVQDADLETARRAYFDKFPFAEALVKPDAAVAEKTAGTAFFVLHVRQLFLVDNRLGFGVRREIALGQDP